MRYDLHVHTERSPCSDMEISRIIRIAKEKGLDGIAITDHDKIPIGLERYTDIDIIPGMEITTEDGGHVLAYYIKEKVSGTFDQVLEQLKKQGCIIALAHPRDILRRHFRQDQIHDERVDAIETINGRTILSGKIGTSKATIGGSDAHFYEEIGKVVTEFEGTLREAIAKRRTTPVGRPGLTLIPSARSVMKRFVHG